MFYKTINYTILIFVSTSTDILHFLYFSTLVHEVRNDTEYFKVARGSHEFHVFTNPGITKDFWDKK